VVLGTYAAGAREVVAMPQDDGWTVLDLLTSARGEDLDRDEREITAGPVPLGEAQALAKTHLCERRAEGGEDPPPSPADRT
jgi:hypothetical protein